MNQFGGRLTIGHLFGNDAIQVNDIGDFIGHVDEFGAVRRLNTSVYSNDRSRYLRLFEASEGEFPVVPIKYIFGENSMSFISGEDVDCEETYRIEFDDVIENQWNKRKINEGDRDCLEAAVRRVQGLYIRFKHGQPQVFVDEKFLADDGLEVPEAEFYEVDDGPSVPDFIAKILEVTFSDEEKGDTLKLEIKINQEGFIFPSEYYFGIFHGDGNWDPTPFAIDRKGTVIAPPKLQNKIGCFTNLRGWCASSDKGITSWHSDFARRRTWTLNRVREISVAKVL